MDCTVKYFDNINCKATEPKTDFFILITSVFYKKHFFIGNVPAMYIHLQP